MGYLTFSHLHLSAYRVETNVELDALRNGMTTGRYSGNPPTSGWAHISWRTEGDDGPKLDRKYPGNPAIEDFGNDYRLLLGRYYADQANHRLRRQIGPLFDDMPPEVRFDVHATDVIAMEGRSLWIFIASQDENEVDAVLAGLRRAAGAPDRWLVTPLPKLSPTSDIYLWMLHRWHTASGVLSPTLRLVEFNTLSTRDHFGHVTRSLSGIDLDRVDTLGAAAEANDLGPAKFVLLDKQIGIRADLFLLLDGKYDIHRTGTEYTTSPMDKAQLGIFATVDIATKVLPRLHNAYKADKDWPMKLRAQFISSCRSALAARFNN